MNKSLILLGVLVLAILGIALFTIPSPQPVTPTNGNGEEVEVPVLSQYFQERIIALAIADIGQPIEGFDNNLIIMAFPGIIPADFENVEAFEGHYELDGIESVFVRDSEMPMSSAERTISPIGYDTLLKNLSKRLVHTVSDEASVDALIQKVDLGQRVDVAFGLSASALGVTVIPTELLEDSRCPIDVQCIQAGTVRIKATLVSGMGTSTGQIFELMKPVTTEAEEITLMQVAPTPVSTEERDRADYMFQFEIKKRD